MNNSLLSGVLEKFSFTSSFFFLLKMQKTTFLKINGFGVKCFIKSKYRRIQTGRGRSGTVDRASDFGPRGPWFDSPPVHISL